VSGLSDYIAAAVFADIGGLPVLLMILIVCLTMTFLTEFTSNTASTQLVLPILAAAAMAQQVHPLVFMVPATFSASMAFMMPVATPPNAIIFGSERVSIREMCKAGLVLNLIGVILITLTMYFVAQPVLGFE
jgi:sodium-dependent dicarboxylate transporter 2/3/5